MLRYWKFINSIHLFKKYLLSVCCILDTNLNSGDRAVEKTKFLSLWSLLSVWGEIISK